QIGRPLLFSDVKGNAVVDFGRDGREKQLIAAMREQSLIACPIESYGEAVGAIVVTRNEDDRNFDAEDLEFVQSVAERLGAAIHIHQLTRISQEGHRAAEELARREVDALAQMMAERSARLDSILGSMTDGLWVYDAAGDVIDVNQAALTMFGLGSRSEAVNLGSFERFYLRYPDGRPIPRDDFPYA